MDLSVELLHERREALKAATAQETRVRFAERF
jgi:hypothetical protein